MTTTMTAPARRSAASAFAEEATSEVGSAAVSRRDAGSAERLQRRRDRRVAAAAEAGWLLALR